MTRPPRRLADFPDDHAILAQLVAVVESQMQQFSDFKDAIFHRMDSMDENQRQLNLRERERNGNIERLHGRLDRVNDRFNVHDEHHGENDENIADRFHIVGNRIEPLEKDLKVREADGLVHKGRRDVILAEWKLIAVVIGAVLSGIGLSELKDIVDWLGLP